MTRGLLRAAAWLLPLAALLYLGFALSDLDLSEFGSYLNSRVLGVACIVALLYGAGLYLLAFAWSACLQKCSRNPVSPEAAVQLYAFATFAKYLPGNVFHYAGRQIAAARLGYGQKAPAQATFLEILGHLAAVGVILLALLPFTLSGLAALLSLAGEQLRPWIFAGLLCAVAGIVFLWLSPKARELLPALDLRLLSFVGLLQLSFFALVALLGVWLAIPVLNLPQEAMPLMVFVYLASWLIGFVTPGAPGGLGVREACLLAGLGGLADPEAVLAFAALTRGAFLVGEALFSISGFLFRPGQEVSAQSRPSATAR